MPKAVSNRPCKYPGCAGISSSGPYCDKHKRTDKRHYPEYQKLYNTRAWKLLRLQHLREHPFCKVCGITYDLQVDHVEDHKGDTNLFFEPKNLETLCIVHHSQKTGKTTGYGNNKK